MIPLTKTCARCKESKILECFNVSKRLKYGRASHCKDCSNLFNKESRIRTGKQKLYIQNNKQNRDRLRDKYREWKRQCGCAFCREDEPSCLELHHLDPSKKERSPSDFASISWKGFLAEAIKCIVLCSNCHKKVHAGLIEVLIKK